MTAQIKRIGTKIVIAAICILALFGGKHVLSEWRYEQMKKYLDGPFAAFEVGIVPTGKPVSSITGIRKCSLEFHPGIGTVPPTLTLKSRSGEAVWCKDLSLIKSNYNTNNNTGYAIYDMRLSTFRRTKQGYEVHFICRWTGGKSQEGILRLDTNGNFIDLFLESSESIQSLP